MCYCGEQTNCPPLLDCVHSKHEKRESHIEGHCQIVSERTRNTRREGLGPMEAVQVWRIAIHDQYQWAHLKGVCSITHGCVFSKTKL